MYLLYLHQKVIDAGVSFKRAALDQIKDAVDLTENGVKADVVINFTGLMASKLGGVADSKVYPVRGQEYMSPACHHV